MVEEVRPIPQQPRIAAYKKGGLKARTGRRSKNRDRRTNTLLISAIINAALLAYGLSTAEHQKSIMLSPEPVRGGRGIGFLSSSLPASVPAEGILASSHTRGIALAFR